VGLISFQIMATPKPNNKQLEAYTYLKSDDVNVLFYGGAAGGGKSWLGCEWLMRNSYYLPNTRWFIGRNNLSDTRESVLITFKKVANAWGFNKYKYSENKIVFDNGSEIVFLDLSFYPMKDPLFERFGSKEFTGGWIEEAGEVHFLAFDVLKSRIGRHLNKELNLKSKILITANPKKNWLYTTFYKKWRENKLQDNYKFIAALYTDNPHLTKDYESNLSDIKDKTTRERLKNGNWEYNDDPDSLCTYRDIIAIFQNDHNDSGNRYITIDAARFGSDKAILFVWDDWIVIDYKVFAKSATTDIQNQIKVFRDKYKIKKQDCVCDEDGLGGGIVDNSQIEGFTNNAKAFPIKGKTENYKNLQSQCGFGLADKINDGELWIKCEMPEQYKEEITEELEQLKTFQVDNERQLAILPKKEIKQNIGRSPDWRDVLLMRYYFEVRPKKKRFRINA